MQAIRSLILTLCVINLAFAERSPVFLWGANNSVAKPSLQTVQPEDFKDVITPILVQKPCIVFCRAEGLSNKDFSCTNDGKSCYAHLQGVKDKTFYASVQNPVETLGEINGGAIEYNTVDASGKFAKPLETEAGKINFVKVDGELKSQDTIMAVVTKQLSDNFFFLYTSAPSTSTLKRQRRASTGAPQGVVWRSGAELLLYYTSLSISVGTTSTVLDIASMDVGSTNSTSMSVTLKPVSGSSLTFNVTTSGGYFFMKNVTYTHGNKTFQFLSSDVYAPTDFSYFCGNLTLTNIPSVEVPAYTLKWNSLQFQAPSGNTNTSFAFGDAWHCVGFFTGGILSGLLIVALLLSITFIGVCWMMDINTMDRFDDPKGKTITINASD